MSEGWKWSAKLKGLMATVVVFMVVSVVMSIVTFFGEETAEAGEVEQTREGAQVTSEKILREMEEWDRQFDARMEDIEREATERRAALDSALEVRRNDQPPLRKVKQWTWEAPAETRARIWNIPDSEMEDAVVTGLLRICTSEQEGSEEDCLGIWQVLNNIRMRRCDRQRYRRITECEEDGGETMLSAMRRAQRFALGVAPPRSRRSMWISEMEQSCEMPPSYSEGETIWSRRHRTNCERTVMLARGLVGGETRGRLTEERIIAWGGRCEDPGGACDDPLACARGLVRVKGLSTANAFWRRARSPDEVEPVCQQYLRDSRLGSPSSEETDLAFGL